MIFYHGTTKKRALEIFKDDAIKKDVERHYTEEKSGGGYSTQGYIYLTNEITFSIHFADCCNLEDKVDSLVLFKMDIPIEKIQPDYDEIRIQNEPDHIRGRYEDDLDFSLREFKSCRIDFDIKLNEYNIEYCIFDLSDKFSPDDLAVHVGYNYEYVIDNYTDLQIEFINNVKWVTCTEKSIEVI